jgi:hypothetical protein
LPERLVRKPLAEFVGPVLATVADRTLPREAILREAVPKGRV